MSITFYAASGSPYAWRVWLALEHKQLAYELRLLSLSAGDTRTAQFVALNPRHKVPVLVDDGYVIREAVAIVEYLEDRFAERPKLFPGDAQARGVVRRVIAETEAYLGPACQRLTQQIWFTPSGQSDSARIHADAALCEAELRRLDEALEGDFLAGPLSAADYTLYPRVAVLGRLARTNEALRFAHEPPQRLAKWMRRIEALPFFAKTRPPHWR